MPPRRVSTKRPTWAKDTWRAPRKSLSDPTEVWKVFSERRLIERERERARLLCMFACGSPCPPPSSNIAYNLWPQVKCQSLARFCESLAATPPTAQYSPGEAAWVAIPSPQIPSLLCKKEIWGGGGRCTGGGFSAIVCGTSKQKVTDHSGHSYILYHRPQNRYMSEKIVWGN